MTDFEKKCYAYLCKYVPAGKVITYGDLAKAIGHNNAARAVGSTMRKNPNAPQVPCHRVIKSNGLVGDYLYGKSIKIDLLRQEGVAINGEKVAKEYILKPL